MTLAVPPRSPAFDRIPSAGCSPADQRGVTRPRGPACDIGAFELGVAPLNRTLPSIAGTTVVGETLAAGRGGWLYGPTGFALQWLRCDAAGGACTSLPGATGVTYRLTAGDAERTLRVSEAASNAFGRVTATSAPTALVRRPPRSDAADQVGDLNRVVGAGAADDHYSHPRSRRAASRAGHAPVQWQGL